MGALTERTRWRIAHLLGRLPGQCWANLVSWAIDGPAACRRRGDSSLPWRPIDGVCRSISPPNDRCYCGKVCSPQREQRAEEADGA